MENDNKTKTTTARRTRAKPAVKLPTEPVAAPADAPAVEVAALEVPAKKAKKEVKVKVVRDSFTMPQAEYKKIADIKEACLKAGRHVKKSEVLRAGLQALVAMSEAELLAAIVALDAIPTGRPKKR